MGRLVRTVLCVAAAALVATAAPASAAVPGLVRVAKVSVSNSVGKGVTADCPAGKQLVGGGGEITGGLGEVGIEVLRPNGGTAQAPTSYRVFASEIDPIATNWTVTAYAICANPVPGLVRISSASGSTSADKEETAQCPAGKQLVGTGAEISGGAGQVAFDDLSPNGNQSTAPTEFSALAREADPHDPEWRLISYAVCANPLPGLSRSAVTSGGDSEDFKIEAAECPAGKRLTGLGAKSNGTEGEGVIDDLRPNGSPVTAPNTSAVRLHEEDPVAGIWSVTAFAICANA